MSATEEATINPDGTQTMGGDAYAGAANPGPEADAMGGDDAGADADADADDDADAVAVADAYSAAHPPLLPPPPSATTWHAFVGRVYACVLLYIIQNNT